MSAQYNDTDLNKLAKDAERNLNSEAAIKGHGDSSSFNHDPYFVTRSYVIL
jgi:hypothetical protein